MFEKIFAFFGAIFSKLGSIVGFRRRFDSDGWFLHEDDDGSDESPDAVHARVREEVHAALEERYFSPWGFTAPFDPTLHTALPPFQRQAVHEIFGKLGVKWIPPLYWECLNGFPDPIEAFQVFLAAIGQPGVQYARDVDRDQLEAVVGILVEIDILGLTDKYEDAIRLALKMGRMDQAEQVLAAIHAINDFVDRAASWEGTVPFPVYKVFLADVLSLKDDPLSIGAEDLEGILELNKSFLDLAEAWHFMAPQCQEKIDFIVGNWPDNEWGNSSENQNTAAGLVAERDRVVGAIFSLAHEDFFAATDALWALMGELEEVYIGLETFISELLLHISEGWESPDMESLRWNEWCEALAVLGFDGDTGDDPCQAAVKKAYRKLALKHHPDFHHDKSPAEQKKSEEMLKSINWAFSIYGEGKPHKPGDPYVVSDSDIIGEE